MAVSAALWLFAPHRFSKHAAHGFAACSHYLFCSRFNLLNQSWYDAGSSSQPGTWKPVGNARWHCTRTTVRSCLLYLLAATSTSDSELLLSLQKASRVAKHVHDMVGSAEGVTTWASSQTDSRVRVHAAGCLGPRYQPVCTCPKMRPRPKLEQSLQMVCHIHVLKVW